VPSPNVRHSFDRAAASYDAAARLQRQVCALLLDALPEPPPARLLDAGCGTGHALGLLAARYPQAQRLALDFAPAMLAAAGGGLCADVEALPLAAGSIDLYWSSLTLQWCDLGRAVGEAARVLAPGGSLAVSSLAPGTLCELDAAFAGIDPHRHVLEFAPPEALPEACRQAGLTVLRADRRQLILHHPSLAALLRELKALGAHQVGAPRRPGLLGRRAWAQVEARYEARRTAEGLPATFEVVLCTARKATS
jgi:malonyl-CoA O-methyltransferase